MDEGRLRREFDGEEYKQWKYETHPNLTRTLAVQVSEPTS